jgi:diguanylate cyclase (GGDEF)-like protein
MLCGSVSIALFLVQMMIFVPSIVTQHQYALANLQDVESGLVNSALLTSDPEASMVPDGILSDTLVGLVLISEDNRLLLDRGNTLDFAIDSALPESSGSIKVAVNQLNPRSGSITAIAFVNTQAALIESIIHLVLYTLLAAFVSAVAALICLWGVFRLYIAPMDRLIDQLRDSRQSSKGSVPDPIDIGEHNDLSPIADEFNSLIEQQRESHRQIRVKQQYLEFAAHHDTLTHLPNRLMFEAELKNTVRDALANRLQFAVFLVDIDNFKFFNDQYGHLVGDKMVAEVGNRLRSMMRDIDVVARLDGDEFVVIQKEVKDPASAEEVARRIMRAATASYEYRGFTLKAAVSVGISCFPHDVHMKQKQELLGEEIVNNAAVALQESKSNGKNQFQRFNEKMRRRLTARIRLEQDLKMALQDGQFEVFYQPKINIHSRQCTGSEALVRWRHPVNGFVSPEAFVPVAEETGMIIELGKWILETAC